VQKYVNAVLPRIISSAKDSTSNYVALINATCLQFKYTDATRQTASLVALTFLIKSIPRASYAQEMPTVSRTQQRIVLLLIFQQLIPLLLRGLELSDNAIRNNVIDTFLAAAEGESPEKNLVSEHSSTLVNSMLKYSKLDELSSTVRYLTKTISTCLITLDSECSYLGVALYSSSPRYCPL
jgi:DNA repair/transcription protein MET18/MMS19